MQKFFFKSIGVVVGVGFLLTACSQPPVENTPTPTGNSPTASPTEEVAEVTQPPTEAPDSLPTPQLCEAGVVEQTFEHGRMFWVGSTAEERCRTEHEYAAGSGEIWVAIFNEDITGGEWLTFPDSWVEGIDQDIDVTLTPPADKLQPERGFGKIWRELLTEEQRRTLGWALYPELAHATEYRYEAGGSADANGVYVPRPGKHILRSFGGELFVFDEQRGTFEYIPAE